MAQIYDASRGCACGAVKLTRLASQGPPWAVRHSDHVRAKLDSMVNGIHLQPVGLVGSLQWVFYLDSCSDDQTDIIGTVAVKRWAVLYQPERPEPLDLSVNVDRPPGLSTSRFDVFLTTRIQTDVTVSCFGAVCRRDGRFRYRQVRRLRQTHPRRYDQRGSSGMNAPPRRLVPKQGSAILPQQC